MTSKPKPRYGWWGPKPFAKGDRVRCRDSKPNVSPHWVGVVTHVDGNTIQIHWGPLRGTTKHSAEFVEHV